MRIAAIILLLFFAGCGRSLEQPQVGNYRALLQLPGGEAPVGLELAREQDRYVMYLSNGAERTRVPEVTVAQGKLQARFPGYENRLTARMLRSGLEGEIILIKSGGVEQKIPFKATFGDTYRFFRNPATDNADISGRWDVTFTDEDGSTSSGVAVFDQQHDRITGTVMTPTGDQRFLEGQAQGDEVQLSTFAGGLAYLYKLKVAQDGELTGEFWQGQKEHQRVVAKRNADATLAEIGSTMKDAATPLNFSFRDIDGKTVSLSDERFHGKVVVVTLGGSWCPNCHDEAAFLAPFYLANRDRGFEVISLMFERHGDFAKAAAAARRFRDDMGVEYPVLIAGISDKDEASKALPGLSGVFGFPTAIFVDRNGAVRRIHTGFTGPATGEQYDRYVSEFTELINTLLAEAPAVAQ